MQRVEAIAGKRSHGVGATHHISRVIRTEAVGVIGIAGGSRFRIGLCEHSPQTVIAEATRLQRTRCRLRILGNSQQMPGSVIGVGCPITDLGVVFWAQLPEPVPEVSSHTEINRPKASYSYCRCVLGAGPVLIKTLLS